LGARKSEIVEVEVEDVETHNRLNQAMKKEVKQQANDQLLLESEAGKAQTYGRYEQFLDLFSGVFQLDGRSVLGVFNCDENMKILVQMFPLGFTAHLLLLHAVANTDRRLKPRLHDTTCCQTGCQTVLTTG